MAIDFEKVTYVDGETVIGAENLNDIQDALLDLDDNKVEKEPGKGLSANDYTDADKQKVDDAYVVPEGGIPKSALASAVQTSLGKADTALQEDDLEDLTDDVDDLKSAYNNKNVKFVCGVLRNNGQGWHVINDADHNPLNISGVSVDNAGNIVIDYGFTAKKVLSLVTCPDETFASMYDMGASVGLSSSTIYLYRKSRAIGGYVGYSGGNWYLSESTFSSATWDSTNYRLTLQHETLPASYGINRYFLSVEGQNCICRLFGTTSSSIIVQFYNNNNVLMTEPNGNMRAQIFRYFNDIKMNANDIVSSSGNIWVFGIMEVD